MLYQYDGELRVELAGHTYYVRFTKDGTIVATACIGRWLMGTAATGDKWLDSQLAKAVKNHITA